MSMVLKQIPNFSKYFVSDTGEVYRKLNPRKDGRGYLQVRITNDEGKYKEVPISHAVAKAFIPNDNPDRVEVNHKNKIRIDNSVENLEWCTKSENIFHRHNWKKQKKGDPF